MPLRDFWTYRDDINPQWSALVDHPNSDESRDTLKDTSKPHGDSVLPEKKAKDIVFCPDTSSKIKETMSRCQVCAEFETRNPKQPMQTHNIPDRPWSRVARPFHPPRQRLCSAHGLLLRCHRSWHMTSSPHHPNANGKKESGVKIAKELFKKARG